MERIAFVVPYYGKLPSYFRIWTYTAGHLENQEIYFYVITDLEIDFELPKNVYIINITFEELKRKIQDHFDFEISLDSPYKLCDFKPAYGFIFSDLLTAYDFWGHCDIDVIWGNVRKYITSEILQSYDKILYLGHFVLYRNCEEMNLLFKKNAGLFNYRKVYSTPEYYSYDEHPGIMQIVQKYGINNYIETIQADISPRYKSLYISRQPNYKEQMLCWINGKVIRLYLKPDGSVSTDEFMYAHFQQKKPSDLVNWEDMCSEKAIIYSYNSLKDADIALLSAKDLKNLILSQSTGYEADGDKYSYLKRKLQKFGEMGLKQKIVSIKISLLTKKTIGYLKCLGVSYERGNYKD